MDVDTDRSVDGGYSGEMDIDDDGGSLFEVGRECVFSRALIDLFVIRLFVFKQ